DGGARRPARSQGRSGRLGRAHPVRRNAQLRAARAREPASLSRPLRSQTGGGAGFRSAGRRKACSCAGLCRSATAALIHVRRVNQNRRSKLGALPPPCGGGWGGGREVRRKPII